MNITEPFVLKGDVLLVPVADLSDDVRARIAFEEGDYTLSIRHGRALAQVIDGGTAALLALFREPRTIVDAVIENSRALDRDPEERLNELLPHLDAFVDSRVLVQAGSDDEKEIRPQYDAGMTLDGWKIVRCASLVEDSEIYQLRNGEEVAALKIARVTDGYVPDFFANEVDILRHLDGSGVTPRLLGSGVHDDRPYFIAEWCGGVDSLVAASQRRYDRAALLELCASIASAYATLHARRVLHGDVHARNVLAENDVKLVDFGYSRYADRPPATGRGGMAMFYEPEYYIARAQNLHPYATFAGEQYGVAALLYLLITGHHYLDFRYERDEMAQQVINDPPVSFAARHTPPWPEVEAILFRALEKDPVRRFASMDEMAARLAEARDAALRDSLSTPVSEEAHALLDATLRTFARGGAMFAGGYPEAPTASINYGAAGAAVGLLRIAETRGDPKLLALADVWRTRAIALIGTDGAYYDADRDLAPELLGATTPYHTEAGIWAASAMIAAAKGDPLAFRHDVHFFLEASQRPCANLDLTLGRSGTLLATALLLECGGDDAEAGAPLRAFGSETMDAIWKELDTHPAIGEADEDTNLGIAHGWAGYLYAALRWCAASGDPLPAHLVERLHQYAPLKTIKGRGIFWRPSTHTPAGAVMPGWCNGSAGQVFLFTLAHELLGDPQWLELAELAAWNNWDDFRGPISLCCGTAGRAYALLNFYKHTGATEWLARARHLANHAAENAASATQRANSLWKGELGVAVLIADLASPENALMPLFE
ncbi:MAG TPA: lanthionine synthetase LanC family protein [Thermoanaerobaculia bacterium]|nr:lanthionine synthetase LanC family protein [Thermoanaerobaculia bacterium]